MMTTETADIKELVETIAKNARQASRGLATLPPSVKDGALLKMADALEAQAEKIKTENALDIEAGKQNGLSSALLDRLLLDDKRIKGMADGMREIVALPDPVGEVTGMKKRPNGMMVGKMRVPLGVIGIIYESRPNVTADTSALCLKSGNAVILRGGSEAIHSNRVIAKILSDTAKKAGIPENAIQLVQTTNREAVKELLKLDKYIDVIIPRGGYELIRFVSETSVIPVIKHDKGVCHVYVDKDADIKMAEDISFNSKVQRPGVCNAVETLLVHEDISAKFLPGMITKFIEAGVEIRGCEKTCAIVPGLASATSADWDEEYHDLVLSVRVVKDFDEAIDHLADHGSGHTE
ncbi:Gamma-glutamyl phosphate reductase, partial [hydrothermal vent metagenome]